MTLLRADHLRVAGYEGKLSSHQTPGRQLPIFSKDTQLFRVVSWVGEEVRAEPIEAHGDITLFDSSDRVIPRAYFVVLGDSECRHAAELLHELRKRGVDTTWTGRTGTSSALYLCPASAERVWNAVRTVAKEALLAAARSGKELEELAWWLYAAATTADDIALARHYCADIRSV